MGKGWYRRGRVTRARNERYRAMNDEDKVKTNRDVNNGNKRVGAVISTAVTRELEWLEVAAGRFVYTVSRTPRG